MIDKTARTALATLTAVVAMAAAAPTAQAFTTGGHFTATARGLKRAGFDGNAIRHVQAANYSVDHMVNLPDEVLPESSNAQKGKNVAKFFHMDGLHLPGYIDREFAFIDTAMTRAVQDAKSRRDPKIILNALGIASHAIQDFYSHSNMADIDWQAWKGSRVVTLDDVPVDIWQSPWISGRWSDAADAKGLFSGMPSAGGPYGNSGIANYPSHGSSTQECSASTGQHACGLNHDGGRRRNNLVAIMMAAEATYDLAERTKAKVADPSLWGQVVAPGASGGVDAVMERAQAMSMAAGQWGWEHDKSYVQIVLAFHATGIPITWDVAWINTLFSMWLAAPTAHATGGGADPFPANNVTLFGLRQPAPPPNPSVYAAGYNTLWGAKRGGLDLTVSGSNLVAALTLDNKVYQDPYVRVAADGGLQVKLRSSDGVVLTGTVYVTGPNRDLSGFLRDGVAGVPDGFVAIKRKLGELAPGRPDLHMQ
ncbi:MAG: hypothetical protein HOO96_10885 [Polyangiaceae bacterium]|nr:hypothetical protein [Polyangiaceae bacterium]